MKKLKYILAALVMSLAICVPVVLTGCTKHYTITVKVVAGEGTVKTVDSLTQVEKNLVKDNDVEGGSVFEYSAVPLDDHSQVAYIKVDGVEIYNVEWAENKYEVRSGGVVNPMIDNVDANHTIEVAFEYKSYDLAFYYTDGGEYKLLTLTSGEAYKITKQYNTTWAPEGFGDMEFYAAAMPENGVAPSSSSLTAEPLTSFTFVKNSVLCTSKSEAELKTFLGLVAD